MLPLVLYDVLSKLPGNNWSPNTAKPRFALSYKHLPFVTVWVEFSDIHIAMKAIGAKPNKRQDGSDLYTVPVLNDPNTGALITDSFEIVSYLEKTYPDKPIFPNNSEPLISVFDSAYVDLIRPAARFIIVRYAEILSPASAKFVIQARTADFQVPWDEFSPEGPKRSNTVYEWYQKSDGKWIMGDTFSYADIIVGCWLLMLKRLLKEGEWARISSWNGGKWAQVLADVGKECKLA
ncbi:uncharacterized protein EDB91DRAFT_1239813 [Suillus paluster]|uniref:uncharacterized protein n=1 Tax=Suillus paluster TaxID=48578 RepID=UPI001B85D943|nr:uncharacterized protein EDB91DRAFT_1239813 [Suillus paluster]KAG1725486.1 hypothetical protein EDB91DRAFT_1239813 [Suillus paluster]